eukprot:GHVU01144568.1.p1 GENE.GHVU01144568.1~~GHVU01144568.1.p1  ORF type:complete len:209 (+),score=34.91 GHVU01144568.1:56-682(+)
MSTAKMILFGVSLILLNISAKGAENLTKTVANLDINATNDVTTISAVLNQGIELRTKLQEGEAFDEAEAGKVMKKLESSIKEIEPGTREQAQKIVYGLVTLFISRYFKDAKKLYEDVRAVQDYYDERMKEAEKAKDAGNTKKEEDMYKEAHSRCSEHVPTFRNSYTGLKKQMGRAADSNAILSGDACADKSCRTPWRSFKGAEERGRG